MKNIKIYYFIIFILLGTTILFGLLYFNTMKDKDVKRKDIELNNLQFSPIVVAKSEKIKLGEDYIAGVYLAVVDSENPHIVLIQDSIDNMNNLSIVPKDPLVFNKEYQTFLYKSKPKAKGIYNWGGIIHYAYKGKMDSVLFMLSYEVEE